jgi:hypothetical protein
MVNIINWDLFEGTEENRDNISGIPLSESRKKMRNHIHIFRWAGTIRAKHSRPVSFPCSCRQLVFCPNMTRPAVFLLNHKRLL